MINAIFHYAFLQHALTAALLASVACGIMGTIIIEKKMVMMSGGIAHTAFGGIGLGYFLGIEPIIGALFFSITSSVGIAAIKRNSTTDSDVLVGMFWPLGMALGIIFIALTPGYPPDISSYLFGDILTVANQDLWFMIILDMLIIAAVGIHINLIKAYLFDEEFSTALGLNMRFIDYMTFVLIAITVVVIIRVVGIILILALLCVPPTIARMFTYNIIKMMGLSIVLGALFCLCGLWASYSLQVSSGASIVIIAVSTYVLLSAGRAAISRLGLSLTKKL
jgi:zinc transport system permease protein